MLFVAKSTLLSGMAAFALSAGVASAVPGTTGSVTYTGIEGPFNSLGVLNTVPANLALNPTNAPAGSTAFASSEISGGGFAVHQTEHLNDGNYSNSRSWIGGFGNENNLNVDVQGVGIVSGTVAGIDLKGPYSLTNFAFGSDNGNFLAANGAPNDPNEDNAVADTGFYHDRTGGTYYVQYTTSATPATAADSAWLTLGTVALVDGTNDSYRHLYAITGGVTATGLRIVLNNGGNRIDEIEIYGTPIPEPTTLGLLGLGGSMLFARRRR